GRMIEFLQVCKTGEHGFAAPLLAKLTGLPDMLPMAVLRNKKLYGSYEETADALSTLVLESAGAFSAEEAEKLLEECAKARIYLELRRIGIETTPPRPLSEYANAAEEIAALGEWTIDLIKQIIDHGVGSNKETALYLALAMRYEKTKDPAILEFVVTHAMIAGNCAGWQGLLMIGTEGVHRMMERLINLDGKNDTLTVFHWNLADWYGRGKIEFLDWVKEIREFLIKAGIPDSNMLVKAVTKVMKRNGAPDSYEFLEFVRSEYQWQRKYCDDKEKLEEKKRTLTELYLEHMKRMARKKLDVSLGNSPLARMATERMEKRKKEGADGRTRIFRVQRVVA
ncbi:MAG: hypothetical protein WCT31_03740, partial [Candidatus Micrarchaeia archaeon]